MEKVYYGLNLKTKTLSKLSKKNPLIENPIIPAYVMSNEAASIKVKFLEDSQDVEVSNPWETPIIVTLPDGSEQTIEPGESITISVKKDEEITITESKGDETFRGWNDDSSPLIQGGKAEVTEMPPMDRFTEDTDGTTAGDNFFKDFNNGGSITKFPEGSFDTSKIEEYGDDCFNGFNKNGNLETLPDGSFRFDDAKTAGKNFCKDFNNDGDLEYLPEGSFNTENMEGAGSGSFSGFSGDNSPMRKDEGTDSSFKNVTSEDIVIDYGKDGEQTIRPGEYFNFQFGPEPSYTEDFTLEATEAGTMIINNQWFENLSVTKPDGTKATLSTTLSIPVKEGDQVKLDATSDNTFRRWRGSSSNAIGGFIKGVKTKITSMPKISRFTTDVQGTIAGDNFFDGFNIDGTIVSFPEKSLNTSSLVSVGEWFFGNFSCGSEEGTCTTLHHLPEGSFDTSNIETVGDFFLAGFNDIGSLLSVPEGSFNLGKIKDAKTYFCISFNHQGGISELPANAFNIDSMTTVGHDFFNTFNQDGKIKALPEGSFDTSNITGFADDNFFYEFNNNGDIESAPEGSFRFDKITSVGEAFLYGFNYGGAMKSLPEGSFNTENITSITKTPSYHLGFFNRGGALESLPEGSFRINTKLTSVGSYFCVGFNYQGKALKTLPAGSFNIGHITNAPAYFFGMFNFQGSLTSLGEGSFDTSGITTAGEYFFFAFNDSGSLESLPEGSFKLNNITSVGPQFFCQFNYRAGALRTLPEGSFNFAKLTRTADQFFTCFNSDGGCIEKLPKGSFNIDKITSVDTEFFSQFTWEGCLRSLPYGSFKNTHHSWPGTNESIPSYMWAFTYTSLARDTANHTQTVNPTTKWIYNTTYDTGEMVPINPGENFCFAMDEA